MDEWIAGFMAHGDVVFCATIHHPFTHQTKEVFLRACVHFPAN
jgi:hypothetical protein